MYVICGICTLWTENLPTLLCDFSPDEIFNADETVLFIICRPDKTFTFNRKQFNGGVFSKKCFIITLHVNAVICQKFPMILILKSQNQSFFRCF